MLKGYRFRPHWFATLAMLVICAGMVWLGIWQWHRAEKNQILESFKEERANLPPQLISGDPVNALALEGRKVKVRGSYETQYQFLLDNQIYGDISPQPGYHVLTPLHIENSNARVLVNRGWVRLGVSRSELPKIETPDGVFEITGYAVTPKKAYLLKEQTPLGVAWEQVWQAVDLTRFSTVVPYPVQPIMIQLDPDNPAGGFVREWRRPSVQVKKNIGYSIQWFAMAITLVVIYVAMSLKKIPSGDEEEAGKS